MKKVSTQFLAIYGIDINLSWPVQTHGIVQYLKKNRLIQPMTKNTKTGKGDIPNLVKETFSLNIKLSHYLEQFMIQNIVCRPKAILRHGN